MRAFESQLNKKPRTFIIVRANGICGLLGSCLVKRLSIIPPSNSFVDVKELNNTVTLSHYKGIVPAGNYGYTIYFDNSESTMCSGNFYLDSKKSDITINVYSDTCKQSSITAF